MTKNEEPKAEANPIRRLAEKPRYSHLRRFSDSRWEQETGLTLLKVLQWYAFWLPAHSRGIPVGDVPRNESFTRYQKMAVRFGYVETIPASWGLTRLTEAGVERLRKGEL